MRDVRFSVAHLRDRRREYRQYDPLLRGRPELAPGKFAIFGQGRTGSNVLRSLLHCHPAVHCDGEIFHLRQVQKTYFPIHYLNRRCADAYAGDRKPVYGFKFKIYQLTEDQGIYTDPNRFLWQLHRRGWRFIFLKRENWLRQSASNLVAKGRGRFVFRSPSPLLKQKVTLDCQTLLEQIQWRETYTQQEEALMAQFPYETVTYERDLMDGNCHQATADRCFAYLGLDSAPVQTETLRSGGDRLADTVENYAEVAALLRSTPYARFLD